MFPKKKDHTYCTEGVSPCPYCGSTAAYVLWYPRGKKYSDGRIAMHYIECENICCPGEYGLMTLYTESRLEENKQQLIHAWNMRLSQEEKFERIKQNYRKLLVNEIQSALLPVIANCVCSKE